MIWFHIDSIMSLRILINTAPFWTRITKWQTGNHIYIYILVLSFGHYNCTVVNPPCKENKKLDHKKSTRILNMTPDQSIYVQINILFHDWKWPVGARGLYHWELLRAFVVQTELVAVEPIPVTDMAAFPRKKQGWL